MAAITIPTNGVRAANAYAVIWSNGGFAWRPTAAASAAVGSQAFSEFSNPASEILDSGGVRTGTYGVAIDPALPAGYYPLVELRQRSGGVGTETALDDVIGVADLDWDGTGVVSLSSRLAAAAYTTPPTAAQNADGLIARSIAGGTDGGRTVGQAFAAARNKVAFDMPAAGQFTVYGLDDVTPLWTGTYARGANTLGPLTSTDPA